MRNKEYIIVDVFSSGKYTGNQLAVVMAGDSLGSDEMQNIAREMNFSETAFITSIPGKSGDLPAMGYDVRIFTPMAEIPFAGHPVLGSAYVIATELEDGLVGEVSLNLAHAIINVTIGYNNEIPSLLTMCQSAPVFGRIFKKTELAGVLGLPESAIMAHLPVQEVSTGLPFIIVPIDSLEEIERISLDSGAYYALINDIRPKALLAFSLGALNPENHLHVRMFAPYFGIPEDPATGSGCGCLAAYLLEHQVLGEGPLQVRAEQGVEIGRPSLLRLRAEHENGEITVRVGGAVIPTARGVLL
ncbi:MAG TPA: PhzF family phenazine biosynthesis protein [Nitrospirae bacterium]|nr:PhzF family phenazine biosynthesis protein [Nitrospirota bacterium]